VPTHEPTTTAVALLAAAILLVLSALVSRTSIRVGLPLPIVFLALGMAAGSEGVAGIHFDDYGLAFRLGTVALTLILFDGGLNTPVRAIRTAAGPAGVLATVGVAGVTIATAAGAHLLVGLPWRQALVFGAVVSSTDAAAVFAVLRSGGIQLKSRVAQVLEVESGLNDPMAVILTFSLTRTLVSGKPPGLALVAEVLLEVAVGAAAGVAVGLGGHLLLWRARLTSSGLYPVLTLALALVAFAAPTLLHGSGFLAVFVAGSVLGERVLPHQAGIRRVHDALAWVGQIGMFLVLGLLAFPSRLIPVALDSVLLALFLAFVARPLVVVACLAPFRFPAREALYIGWVGLRGAVPIILAVYPVLAGAPGAEHIFDVVFFVVVVNALVPGWTVRWLARRIGLVEQRAPTPGAVLEISSAVRVDGEILSFYVSPASAVAGSAVADLPFPAGTRVLLVARERQILAPEGSTVLAPGDHVHVFCEPGTKGFVQLLFGVEETE
jgi:cell volume regulation protein A